MLNKLVEKAVGKMGEDSGKETVGLVKNVAGMAIDAWKRNVAEWNVFSEKAFYHYLQFATKRYNDIKTIATGDRRRDIVGPDCCYVKIGVRYRRQELSTATASGFLESLRRLGAGCWIQVLGSGGSGKSMLMRYLLLNAADERPGTVENTPSFIPVLLELRQLGNPGQYGDEVTPADFLGRKIFERLHAFKAELDADAFTFSLELGKYLFLLDGLDEVKAENMQGTVEAIVGFCGKYPKNPCIVTSRPNEALLPLDTFDAVETMELNLNQAEELAEKLWPGDERTPEFCRLLRDEWFESPKYHSFAVNPLLLTMMFLTFQEHGDIPSRLPDFYDRTFEALYRRHDRLHKQGFERDFQCKGQDGKRLDDKIFRDVFAHFCFHTLMKQVYEFKSKRELLDLLNNSLEKKTLSTVSAEEYLADLHDAVCLIVRESGVYKFAHRAFQTYFAAVYTDYLTDEEQEKLYSSILRRAYKGVQRESQNSYLELLIQLNAERFFMNALEEKISDSIEKATMFENPDIILVNIIYDGVLIDDAYNFLLVPQMNHLPWYHVSFNWSFASPYHRLFCKYYTPWYSTRKQYLSYEEWNTRYYYMKKICWNERVTGENHSQYLHLSEIKSSNKLEDEERYELYDKICRDLCIAKIRAEMQKWLDKMEVKRNNLEARNFIDYL